VTNNPFSALRIFVAETSPGSLEIFYMCTTKEGQYKKGHDKMTQLREDWLKIGKPQETRNLYNYDDSPEGKQEQIAHGLTPWLKTI